MPSSTLQRKQITGAVNLVQSLGVTEATLARRRDFLQITEEDRQNMLELIPWAEKNAAEIASELVDGGIFPLAVLFQKGCRSCG